jgi:RNA polymerase sigma factor (sigma-70 family)
MASPAESPAGSENAAEAAANHASALEAFFRSRGHGDEASDLVQEIFVLLLSRGERTASGEPGRFRSFLYAIAYRIGANATRRRRRLPTSPIEGLPEARSAGAGPTPEQAALTGEKVRRAAAALDTLPDGTRRALLLVADEGKSVREVAMILNVSEEVVRARLSRGRRRLASILEERP